MLFWSGGHCYWEGGHTQSIYILICILYIVWRFKGGCESGLRPMKIYRCSFLNDGFKFYASHERWCTTKKMLHFFSPTFAKYMGKLMESVTHGARFTTCFHTIFVKNLPTVDMSFLLKLTRLPMLRSPPNNGRNSVRHWRVIRCSTSWSWPITCWDQRCGFQRGWFLCHLGSKVVGHGGCFFHVFFFFWGGEVVSKKNVWEAIQFACFCHFLYILELEMMQTIRATFLFWFSHGTCNVRDCPLMHVNPCLQQWVCGYWFNMVQS